MADIDWGESSTQTATAPPPAQASSPELPSPTAGIDWGEHQGPLTTTLRQSSTIPPDKATRILNLSDKSGLSPDLVSRNTDQVEAQLKSTPIDADFAKEHPVIASIATQDPHYAAMMGEDLPILGTLEKQFHYLFNQTERAGLDTEYGLRTMAKAFGHQSTDNESRINQIQDELNTKYNLPAPGRMSRILGNVVESGVPMAGAIGVGYLGALAGAPASLGTAATWGALEFGKAYQEFSTRKDAAGAPLMTDNEARGMALLSGAGTAALFASPLGKFIEKIPGLKMLGPGGLASIIVSPTGFQAIRGIAAEIGQTSLLMGGFTGFANLIHTASGHLGEMANDGSYKDASFGQLVARMFPKEDLQAAGKATTEGAETGLAFGALGAGVKTAVDYRNYTRSMQAKDLYYVNNYLQAQHTADQWRAIGSTLQATQMATTTPEQTEKVISRLAPNQQLYVPLEAWQDRFKEDPRAAFKALMGDTKAYDEALRTGTDLQIPVAKYAAKIAAIDHNEYFGQFLRAMPLAMNADEATKSTGLKAEMEQADQEAREKIAREVAPAPEAKANETVPAAVPTATTPEAQAVQEVHDQQGFKPLFGPEDIKGMKPGVATRYVNALDKALFNAEQDVANKIATQGLKEKSKSWQDERTKVQKQVEAEISNQPGFRAVDAFKKHLAPDGLELARLSLTDIEKDYPEVHYSPEKLPENIAVKKGGIHPEDAAMRLGYNSGSELLYDLTTQPDRDALIQRMTDERMLERHPEAGSLYGIAPNIMDEAMKAVHNDQRSRVLRLELEHLASDDFASFKGLLRTLGRRLPTPEEDRLEAQRQIGEKTTAQTEPRLYQRAEGLASREAREFFLQGDFDKVWEAKRRELINHELFRAATDAKEQSDKDMGFARRFDRESIRQRIGKAGGNFLESIDAIRSQFDFAKVTPKQLEKFEGLRNWVQQQREAGFNPIVPEDLLERAGKKSYRDMTNDELHSTVDYLRNIDHQARLKNRLLASAKERTFDEMVQEMTGQLSSKFDLKPSDLDKPIDLHPDWKDKIQGKLNDYGAWHTRMEPLFEWLGLHDQFYDAINKAEDFKTSEGRKAARYLKGIFNDYDPSERAKFGRVQYIPELEGSRLEPNLNKMEMMMTLLHAGNEGNQKELMRGWNLNEAQLKAIWKNLDHRDANVIQRIWDFADSYWPQIAKQERELNGLTPEKIRGRPIEVTLKDGTTAKLEGGYFPLVYDRNASFRTEALQQASSLKEMFPTYAGQTATKHGWTEARVGGGGQAPSLDFSIFTDHMFDVIHDLAYRKPIIDLYKLVNNEDIRSHLEATAGKGIYRQLNPWIKRMAGDRPWDPMGPWEALRTLRSNMTVAEIGLKIGSSLVHMTSLLPATQEIGLKYMAEGFKQFRNIPDAVNFIWDKSEFMKSRWEDVGDRDIRAAGSKINVVNINKGFWNEMKALSPIQLRDAWIVMRSADIAVAGPTWLGAYQRAMDGKVKKIDGLDEPKAIAYADRLVRDTKGSGSAKDLAPMHYAGGSFGKLLTMFTTQLNVIHNQMMNAYREAKVNPQTGKIAGNVMAYWVGPAIAAQLLRGRYPGNDENWIYWGLKAAAKFPLEVQPALAPFARYLESRDALKLSPVEEALSIIAKTAGNVLSTATGKVTGEEKEWTAKDYADAMMTLGYLKGLPTRQIVQSTMRLHNWMSGEEEHENPIGGLWSVATGAKPQE